MYSNKYSLLFHHILPGLLGLMFALIAEPFIQRAGLPPSAALLISLVGVEIFYLYALILAGKRSTGKLSLIGAVTYCKPIPIWQYLIFVPMLIIWTLLAAGLFAPLDLVIK
jgi:hypothetical protein